MPFGDYRVIYWIDDPNKTIIINDLGRGPGNEGEDLALLLCFHGLTLPPAKGQFNKYNVSARF